MENTRTWDRTLGTIISALAALLVMALFVLKKFLWERAPAGVPLAP